MSNVTLKHVVAAAALAGALALPATGAQAQNIGQYLFNKLLGQDTDEPAINYSEKAPLVMPKTRDLPQPMSKAATDDPNWPKDPDAEKRKKKASADSLGPASNNTELLSQEELARGARVGSPANQKATYQTEMEYKRASNPVSPTVMAKRGSFAAVDTPPLDPNVCPPRRTLVDPPGCINKPLASAPLDANAELPSEIEAEQNKPWYQKVWKFGGGGD
jgi:hypothetical protein